MDELDSMKLGIVLDPFRCSQTNYVIAVGKSNGGLGRVGCHNNFNWGCVVVVVVVSFSSRCWIKCCHLIFERNVRVDRHHDVIISSSTTLSNLLKFFNKLRDVSNAADED